jgi:DNA-directed RNA polymerase specialized sigma24 family protein
MLAFCDSYKCRAGNVRTSTGRDELPNLALRHDDGVFRKIVEQLKARVIAVSYALLGDQQEADIAAQKTFVHLYRAAGRLDPPVDLDGLAYRLAIEQCFDRLKRYRKPPPHSGSGRRERLLRVLSALPDLERALIVLREVAQQSVEGIATIMQMDPAVVRHQLFLVRQKLRNFSTAA